MLHGRETRRMSVLLRAFLPSGASLRSPVGVSVGVNVNVHTGSISKSGRRLSHRAPTPGVVTSQRRLETHRRYPMGSRKDRTVRGPSVTADQYRPEIW